MATYTPLGLSLSAVVTRQQAVTLQSPLKPLPGTGTGWLAGTLPGGATTVDGVPTRATVRVLYRPASGSLGDGVVVAEVQSAYDGTWLVTGLNPLLKYDVVGRKPGFNDVIMANVSPKVGA